MNRFRTIADKSFMEASLEGVGGLFYLRSKALRVGPQATFARFSIALLSIVYRYLRSANLST